MKNYTKIIAVSALVALSLNSQATTYTDATGDLHNGSPSGANFTGFTFLDITSVEVNNTATDLIFKINITGDPSAPTDWGKYTIGLNTVGSGDSAGNGWSRPISMANMNYWVGSWVDSGNGAEVHKYTGSWALQNATWGTPGGLSITKNTSSVTITYPLLSLGLSPGNSFVFDVFTTAGGGTDSAVDALSTSSPAITDWAGPFASASTLSYTIPVPEPTSLALLGLGASLMINRIRRR